MSYPTSYTTRPVGTVLDDGESWEYECQITPCATRTQGGLPGIGAHTTTVHGQRATIHARPVPVPVTED